MPIQHAPLMARRFLSKTGVLLLLLLTLAAVVAYRAWAMIDRPHTGQGVGAVTPKPITGEQGVGWYRHNVSYWRQLTYAPLDDRDVIRATVRGWVAERFTGPQFDEAPLVNALTVFWYAQGADNSREYLARLGDNRMPVETPSAERELQWAYRKLMGHALPAGATAHELLDLFWRGSSGAPGRPRALATKAAVQVARAKPLPPEGLPADWFLFNFTYPAFTLWDVMGVAERDHWIAGFGGGFPPVTRPVVSYDEVYARGKLPLVCAVHVAVRTVQDVDLVVHLALYLDHTQTIWYVHWFANYYPYPVCWPY